MMNYIRTHLGVKLFLSYFAVILVGVLILALTVPAVLPQAFNRHLANMGQDKVRVKGLALEAGRALA
jgi:hypothetical protein